MEASDAPLLDASPRAQGARRSKPWSRSSSSGGGGSIVEYTSLRDVLDEAGSDGGGGRDAAPHHHWRAGGGWGECCDGHDVHDFDASTIGIRNQLLKHAASAYLQSAVVVAAGRGDDDRGCCLARLWRRAVHLGGGGGGRRGRVLMRAACSWQLGCCVDDPAEACAALVARSAHPRRGVRRRRLGLVNGGVAERPLVPH